MGFVLVLLVLGALVFLIIKGSGIKVDFGRTVLAPEGTIPLYKGVGEFVEVVGESHYQANLQMARSNAVKNDGRLMFWAVIEPENDNPHDANAVTIKFNGNKLGYLNKGDAKLFRSSHADAISRNQPIVARARLTGGTKGKPNIGVMLDFNLGTQKHNKTKRPSL